MTNYGVGLVLVALMTCVQSVYARKCGDELHSKYQKISSVEVRTNWTNPSFYYHAGKSILLFNEKDVVQILQSDFTNPHNDYMRGKRKDFLHALEQDLPLKQNADLVKYSIFQKQSHLLLTQLLAELLKSGLVSIIDEQNGFAGTFDQSIQVAVVENAKSSVIADEFCNKYGDLLLLTIYRVDELH